ncbi:DUF7405 family protein [Natronomonas sp. EA1]|uniref:DUF7405 family protein n=1 Tax=Natronomonas sp. EA1 TaxID=3421655 RepID=UPI003EC0C141
MSCPYANRARDTSEGDEPSVQRREFMKAMVALGGVRALSRAQELQAPVFQLQTAPFTPPDRDNRQHAWGAFLEKNEVGVGTPPRHHVLLCLDYLGVGEPTGADRRRMEGALRQLERAFEWSNDGLLFTVGYSSEYFTRFAATLPAGVDLADARSIIDEVSVDGESPEADEYEVCIHLASDNATNLLLAEEALWGGVTDLDGVPVDDTLVGLFDRPAEYPGRRTGFVGEGLPREELPAVDLHEEIPGLPPTPTFSKEIPNDAVLSMGIDSGFPDNLPSDDEVSLHADGQFQVGPDTFVPMPPGIFAQGTQAHVSHLRLDLHDWWEDEPQNQLDEMLSPHHRVSEVGFLARDRLEDSGTPTLRFRDPNAPVDLARLVEDDATPVDMQDVLLRPLLQTIEAGITVLHEADLAIRRAILAPTVEEANTFLQEAERLLAQAAEAVPLMEEELLAARQLELIPARQLGLEAAAAVIADAHLAIHEARVALSEERYIDAVLRITEWLDSTLPLEPQMVVDHATVVGHSQKLARARVDLGLRRIGGEPQGVHKPTIQRRDFDTIDSGVPGLHFVSIQPYSQDFIDTRKAMSFISFQSRDGEIDHVEPENRLDGIAENGILEYVRTLRRGNYLLPPLTLRALPPASGLTPTFTVAVAGIDLVRTDEIPVILSGIDGAALDQLDPESIRFGSLDEVDRGRGVAPTSIEPSADGLVLTFPTEGTGLRHGDSAVRLFAYTADMLPVYGTAGTSATHPYVDDSGTVDTTSVRRAIDDWVHLGLETDDLQQVGAEHEAAADGDGGD